MDDAAGRNPILVSDAEREQGVVLLRDAAVEGRLTLEEFSDRVGRAQLARTEEDLAALIRDLPAHGLTAAPPAVTKDHHRAVCSRIERRGHHELAASSSFSSIFGTIVLDLRQATLAGPETDLAIYNLFGTVTVIVPEGVAVDVLGGGLFASQVIDPPATPPVPGAPRLRIRTSGPGGTLYVRSGEPPGRLAKLLGAR